MYKYMHMSTYINYLLTECEVCPGKYLPEVFVQTSGDEGAKSVRKNPEGKYFFVQTKQTRNVQLLFEVVFLQINSEIFLPKLPGCTKNLLHS